MREILFRGKAANREPNRQYRTKYKNGDWVYGLLTDAENYAGFSEMTNTNGVSGIEVDKNTVGQFTGLTDKNGKKIFEGDIVICDDKHKYFVRYHNKWAMYELRRTDDRGGSNGMWIDIPSRCEIIGNIHDNPELLEGA